MSHMAEITDTHERLSEVIAQQRVSMQNMRAEIDKLTATMTDTAIEHAQTIERLNKQLESIRRVNRALMEGRIEVRDFDPREPVTCPKCGAQAVAFVCDTPGCPVV